MSDYAFHSISTPDSSIVFVGMTSDTIGNYDIPASQNDSQVSAPTNLLVGKMDSNKQLAWVKVYGGSRRDEGIKVLQLNNGNYAVLGNTNSYDGDATGLKGQTDIWLLCLDGQGNLLWQKTYGSSTSDEALSFAQTSDGGVIILGLTNGSDYDVPFHYGGFFDFDWLVIKTDSIGNLQWSKNIGGSGSEDGHGSIFQADGGYFMTGSSSSYDHDCDDSSWHIVPHSDVDYYLLKLDTVGNVLWSKSYGGSENDGVSDAIWDERDSTIVISGFTRSIDLMVQNNNNSFYRSIWVIKVGSNGNYLSGCRMGDTILNNDACNVLPFGTNDYIFVSKCYTGFPLWPGRFGLSDTRIYLLDSSCSPYYEKIFGGTEQETYQNLITFKNGYVVSGSTLSSEFFEGINLINNHSTASEVYISGVFDVPDPASVKSKMPKKELLKIFPNPAKDVIRIVLPQRRLKCALTISDNSGRIVYSRQHTDKTEIELDVSAWAKGVYMVKWQSATGEKDSANFVVN